MIELKEQSNFARNILVNKLKDELLGPGSENSLPNREHEIITDFPEVRYSVGVLFPQKNIIAADNDEIPILNESEDSEIDIDESNELDMVFSNDERYEGNIADDLQDDTLDEAVALSTQNRPSSMGLTFFINSNVDYIKLHISFATYQKTEWNDCLSPYNGSMSENDISLSSAGLYIRLENGFLKLNRPFTRKDARLIHNANTIPDQVFIDAIYKLANQCGSKGFKRIPHEATVDINLSDTNSCEVIGIDGVEFAKLVAVKHDSEDGLVSITVMLVNNNEGDYSGTNSIFQPSITISTALNPHIRFVSYANRMINEDDAEEQSLALLYMNKPQYASGHGTSVKWDINDKGLGKISTDMLPVSIVPQMDFDYALKKGKVERKSLSMKYLSDLDTTEKHIKLKAICQLILAYEEWINDIKEEAKQLNDKYKTAADNHIEQCLEVLKRMKDGLNLLETDEYVYNAFQLSNRAMFMQLIHRRMQNNVKVDIYPGDKDIQVKLNALDYRQEDNQYSECIWRPFQLAFLLVNLSSLSNSEHEERNLVDLIWFPTGGGKTEAYLGLTAFTIFYRRLKYLPESGGTAVIMRYTLRLLASQQFSRASTLICACEYIRNDCTSRRPKYPRYNLGKEPITIGLWIGGDHTPNKNCGNDQHMGAREFLNKLDNADANSLKDQKDKFNKFQVLKCPWCGTKMVKDVDKTGRRMIGDWGYRMGDNRHFYLRCPQEG
ncbi:MAG: helicase, partial [Bacillota bacterium]